MSLSIIHYFSLSVCFVSVSCEKRKPSNEVIVSQSEETVYEDPFADESDEFINVGDAPTTLEEALDMMEKSLTEEDRKFIIKHGEAYSTVVHFGGGLAIRNTWGRSSEFRRQFSKMGIHHSDDISSIINKCISRRVRGVDLDLDNLTKYYRDYWAEIDVVAPLDLNCPLCEQEMDVYYSGNRVFKDQPPRPYFAGQCPKTNQFWYYHKEGWTPKNVADPQR